MRSFGIVEGEIFTQSLGGLRHAFVVLQIDFLLADTPVIYGAGGVLLYNRPLRRVRMTTLPEVSVQQRRGLLVGEDNFTG